MVWSRQVQSMGAWPLGAMFVPARFTAARFIATMVAAGALATGCGPAPMLRMTDGSNYRSFVQDRSGGAPTEDLSRLRFRPELCQGEDLRPETATLDELHLVRFLEKQGIDVRVERPRADLTYLLISGQGTQTPIRVRVAILTDADAAGRELHEAMLQHGPGSWGVHRSNLAVLGPIGEPADNMTFAAKTKLACWGVFSVTGTDDAFTVPGAYREL
ncbi:MAG TPA: hypothetical protein VFQ61_29745 [Polyangiaceae bacterium]|nr:hypothetical protein [Polyangiaceae bacterium]